MKIETERLYLRELTPEDFPELNAVLGDDENMKYYPLPFDEERVRNWISRNQERYQMLGFGLWAIVLKETGELIGDCGLTLQLIDGSICPEIGYHVRRDLQEQGYASEAASASLNWAFLNTPFLQIFSYMAKVNIPSAATAQAIGMQKTGEYTSGDEIEHEVYSIRKEEWLKNQSLA